MAENNFLSGLKVDQFIKANNDQIKQTMNSVLGDAQKSVSEMIKLQKIAVVELQKINSKGKNTGDLKKSLDSTLKAIQKENLKVSKARDASLFKSLKGFFSQSKKNASDKMESKSYFQKENYSKKSNSLLDSINKNISALLKKDKDQKKESLLSKIFKFIGGFGKLLFVVGVLTGNIEDMVKGVRWAIKSIIFPINLLVKNLTKVAEVLKGANTVAKGAKGAKDVTTVAKGAKGAKDISTAAKVGGIAAKELAKSGGKTAGKKIPFVGSILSIIFGIQRMSKGDMIGGLLEFVGGALYYVPVAGPLLSVAVDAILAVRDIHEKVNPGSFKSMNTKIETFSKKTGIVPILNVLTNLRDGVALLQKGDYIGGIYALGDAALSGALGPLGVPFFMLRTFIDDFSKSKLSKPSSTNGSGGKGAKPPKSLESSSGQ